MLFREYSMGKQSVLFMVVLCAHNRRHVLNAFELFHFRMQSEKTRHGGVDVLYAKVF